MTVGKFTISKDDPENTIPNNTQNITLHVWTPMCTAELITHLLRKIIALLLIAKPACEGNHKP